MSLALVTTIAIIQGFILATLIVFLCASHWLGAARQGRHNRHRALATHLLTAWFEGESSADEVRGALERLQFSAVASMLQYLTVQRDGDDLEQLASVLRNTRWFARLCKRARSRFWWRRLAAARILSVVASEDEIDLLHDLAEDPNSAVRLAAARVLHRIPSRTLVEVILDHAGPSRAVVRGHLLETLVRSDVVLEAVLIDRLDVQGADSMVIRTALELASQVASPRLLGRILTHTHSDQLEILIAATRALGAFPHASSGARLVELLEHDAWQVRTQAAVSLGRIGATEAREALGHSIMDSNWWVRLRSALSLRLIGPTGIAVLEAVDEYTDYYAYEMAQYVLGLEDNAVAEYASGMLPQDAADRGDRAA